MSFFNALDVNVFMVTSELITVSEGGKNIMSIGILILKQLWITSCSGLYNDPSSHHSGL